MSSAGVLRYSLVPLLALFSFGFTDDSTAGGERKNVFLGQDQTHEGWYFAAGDRVTIAGTVTGDAYVAGGVVEISGTVMGDLIAAGGTVKVSGRVEQDVRAAGGVMLIVGSVGRDVTIAGGSVSVERPAAVRGNLLAASGSVRIAGSVGGEVRCGAGDLSVSGSVGRDLNFAGGRVAILPGAQVGGDLNAMVEKEGASEISKGSVRGKINVQQIEKAPGNRILGHSKEGFWFKMFWMLSLIGTGLVLALVFPHQVARFGTELYRRPGPVFLWGFLGIILIPAVAVLLAITLIGLPLGLLLLSLYLWFWYICHVAVGAALGNLLRNLDGKRGWSLFWPTALGIVLLVALSFVPVVKTVVYLLVHLIGFGLVLLVVREDIRARRS